MWYYLMMDYSKNESIQPTNFYTDICQLTLRLTANSQILIPLVWFLSEFFHQIFQEDTIPQIQNYSKGFKYMEGEEIQHFSHDEHSLIMIELQKKNDNGDDDDDAKVEICYGCQKQILEPTAYCCFSCNFFLHKTCAEIPLQITHPMHSQHPLVLHREPPNSSGSCTCHACGQKGWKFFTYNCSLCKFDLDISCASQDRFAREGQSDLGDPGRNLVKLPSNDAAQNLIKLSLLQCSITSSLRKMNTEEKIVVSTHNHPLVLSKMMQTKHEIKSATADHEEAILSICDWCIEPILLSDPHYACAEGDYFLHKTCYQFPDELQTPKHPEHSLAPMKALAVAGYFRCHACLKEGNCLYYECKSCKFYICIKCVNASLTSAVLHNSHKHLLTQAENTNRITCNACGFARGSFGFGCEDCHFYLDYECTLMPPTTKQKWDQHVLVLTYPPFVDHPDEFFCVICDLQMNPNEWMRHCQECDQSFHPWCIPQIHQNTKFGRAMYVDEHSHPLTHMPEAYDEAFCYGCDNSFDDGEEAFQCTECSYCLCADCACKREVLNP